MEKIERLMSGVWHVRVCTDETEKLCIAGWVDSEDQTQDKLRELKERLRHEQQRNEALAACAVLCDV